MAIKHYTDLVQGSDEWLEARRGILTASEVKLILTPTLKIANNDKTRAHVYEILAQRISGFVEPVYIGFNADRGHEDEMWARVEYSKSIAQVDDMGFITNDKWGFTLGYSPDGKVRGVEAGIECKSRIQKYQIQTIIEHVATGSATIPEDFLMQHQTGLMVSEWEYIDFISYSNGLPMVVIRVWGDDVVQNAIVDAATEFEAKIAKLRQEYDGAFNHPNARMFATERRTYEDIMA